MQQGNLYAAERMFQIVLQQDPKNNLASYNMACIRALSGKKEEALKYLEIALKNGYNDIKHLQIDKDLMSIRKESEYERLLFQYSNIDD